MWRKQEPPHLAHLTKGWCRSQVCLFQAAMLESEYCSVSTLLPQTKAGFSGRKKDGTRKFLQLAFLSLCYCVLIVLDGERRRLRVWGLREKKRMELFELQEGFPSVPAKLVNVVCILFSFTSLSTICFSCLPPCKGIILIRIFACGVWQACMSYPSHCWIGCLIEAFCFGPQLLRFESVMVKGQTEQLHCRGRTYSWS